MCGAVTVEALLIVRLVGCVLTWVVARIPDCAAIRGAMPLIAHSRALSTIMMLMHTRE